LPLHYDWYRPGVYVIPAVALRIAGTNRIPESGAATQQSIFTSV